MSLTEKSLRLYDVKRRAKRQAKRHDVIGACRTLRDEGQMAFRDAVPLVETWLRRWGRIK